MDDEKVAKNERKNNVVPGCTSGTVACANEVKFHSFPKDKSRQRVPLVKHFDVRYLILSSTTQSKCAMKCILRKIPVHD